MEAALVGRQLPEPYVLAVGQEAMAMAEWETRPMGTSVKALRRLLDAPSHRKAHTRSRLHVPDRQYSRTARHCMGHAADRRTLRKNEQTHDSLMAKAIGGIGTGGAHSTLAR